MNKPRLSIWAIWNMSFGFLGIQFGWGLQMANMSSIYQYLGAKPEELALLWLAAPLTGLILQPIIGYCSDRTWNPLGRRRPYFLAGAVCASAALILMPNASALWMAVGLLWILDASVNLSMEPFRAFVADKLPEEQHADGFAMQSVLIGFGAVVSSSLPWMLMNWCGMSFEGGTGAAIPAAVKLAFYIGAGVFLLAVLYTILTTPEYPPEDMAAFRRHNAETAGILNGFKEIYAGIRTMPRTMKQLAASLPPERTGFYMGVFNFFIVIPQIIMSVFLGGWLVKWGGGNPLAPVLVGGLAMIVAAVATRFVDDPEHAEPTP